MMVAGASWLLEIHLWAPALECEKVEICTLSHYGNLLFFCLYDGMVVELANGGNWEGDDVNRCDPQLYVQYEDANFMANTEAHLVQLF